MIVVTGAPRSGTSWVMQDMKLMGFDVAGEMFSWLNIQPYNPKGYWELSLETTKKGIGDEYKDKVVKCFALGLSKIKDIKLIDRIIYCVRSENYAIKSYLKLLKDTEHTTAIKGNHKNAKKMYWDNRYYMEDFFKKNDLTPLTLKFEDKKENPTKEAHRLAEYVGVSDINKIQKAIDNAGA